MSEKFLKYYKYLVIEVLFLIALGGAVRAMNAGLACPDWPLCFGDVIPDYHPQVYFEFIHRVMAGIIMIATTVFTYKILRTPKVSGAVKQLSVFSWILLIAQAVMGGLTVLMQLHDKVVTIHLGLGTGFFAILLWIYLSLKLQSQKAPAADAAPSSMRTWVIVLLSAVYGQILLGGLVASNYAANVCPEFPLCHGQFIPTLSGAIGLQVIHRLGAYTLFALGLGFFIYVKMAKPGTFWNKYSNYFFGILVLQVCIGISNVLFATPPLITVLHLFTGTVLLGIATRMTFTAFVNSPIEQCNRSVLSDAQLQTQE